jgi:hypothetical protein
MVVCRPLNAAPHVGGFAVSEPAWLRLSGGIRSVSLYDPAQRVQGSEMCDSQPSSIGAAASASGDSAHRPAVPPPRRLGRRTPCKSSTWAMVSPPSPGTRPGAEGGLNLPGCRDGIGMTSERRAAPEIRVSATARWQIRDRLSGGRIEIGEHCHHVTRAGIDAQVPVHSGRAPPWPNGRTPPSFMSKNP